LIPSGAAEIIFSEFLADAGGGTVVLVPMHEAEEDRFCNSPRPARGREMPIANL